MRIILIGQAAFAQKVLDGARERGHDVAAVYCPPDAGEKPDPVKARASELAIPVRQHRSLKAPEVQKEFEQLGADLAVLAYVTQIVPANVFSVPRLGSICFHPSLLPRYRGGSAINWQLIKGERETGVTVFWVDPGIDTGPILLQKRASIRPADTAGSLYYDTLFPLGVEAVLESIDLVAQGKAPRLPQDDSRATYDPLCRDEHAAIDWSRPAVAVHDLIRGCDPQPGAHTTFGGEPLRVYEPALVADMRCEPGTIAEVSDAGVLIGCDAGAVRVKRVRFRDKKQSAAEFASAHRVSRGARLGT
jgi:methionyl-tRNA formyltransferase